MGVIGQDDCSAMIREDCNYLGNVIYQSSEGDHIQTEDECKQFCEVFGCKYWVFSVRFIRIFQVFYQIISGRN